MSEDLGVLIVHAMGMQSPNLMPEKIDENYHTNIKGLTPFYIKGLTPFLTPFLGNTLAICEREKV